MARPVVIGAASGSVSVGLALLLLLLAQRPDVEASQKEAPPADIVKPAAKPVVPAQAAVVLPPPPATRAKVRTTKPVDPAVRRPRTPRQKTRPVRSAAKPVPNPPPPKPPPPPRRPTETPAVDRKPALKPAPRQTVARLPIKPEAVSEGRALLRMLEVGKGPTIEIAWPATASGRDRLYAVLERCYGLRSALMAEDGRIYFEDGPAGAPTRINRDRTSGFMRRPAGAMPAAERRLVARIQRRHRREGLAPVRLFPRHVDAVLLAGLRKITGRDYATLRLVRARYTFNGVSVLISDITADRRLLAGQIKLPRIGFRGCK